MTPEEVNKLYEEANQNLEKCTKNFVDCMVAVIRIRVLKDMMFLGSGDKTLVTK